MKRQTLEYEFQLKASMKQQKLEKEMQMQKEMAEEGQVRMDDMLKNAELRKRETQR